MNELLFFDTMIQAYHCERYNMHLLTNINTKKEVGYQHMQSMARLTLVVAQAVDRRRHSVQAGRV